MDLSSCVASLAALDPAGGDRADATEALRVVAIARRLVDAIEIRWNRRLAELAVDDPAISPEHVNATATQRTLRRATDAVRRATRSSGVPVFDDAVAAGLISGEHLDAFARAVHSLRKALQPQLLELQHEMVRHAARLTVEDFTQRVRDEVRRIEDDDGKGRLAQQKQQARAKTWTDADGMWNLLLRLDPEAALPIAEAVRRMTERFFHDGQFDDAPEDPLARHQWLQAKAVVELILNSQPGAGESSTTIVVFDKETLITGERRADSRVDTGYELEIPIDVLTSHSVNARLLPVVIDRDGKVVVMGPAVATPEELRDALLAPVSLNMGRRTRYATKRQQLAIRAMYRHCAIPGCKVPVSNCQIHHIVFWEHGGLTDIDNLLPVCKLHHDRIHKQHWLLQLGPDRSLTIRKDGMLLMTTGPPATQWAAA